jgi:putative colanic acid biosynthesis acetyltransferase WcaF
MSEAPRIIHPDPDEPNWLPSRGRFWFAHLGMLIYNNLITYQPFQFIRINFLRLWGAQIGKGTHLLRGVNVNDIHGLKIGIDCSIGPRCVLDGRAVYRRGKNRAFGLTIGDHVIVASDTHFLPGLHLMNDPNFQAVRAPTVVEDYVWITTRCLIEGGLIIGRGAVVANSSTVRTDVAPMDVVAGSPAKVVGKRESDLTYQTFWRPWFA